MKITKLEIKNFEGLQQLTLEPTEGVTVLQGYNGAGKTSVLEAIRAAITNRAERSRLVFDAEETGTILFELDNGISGTREVNRQGTAAGPISLRRGDVKMTRAQSFLNGISPAFGFNPLDFINLRDDQQTKVLLDLMPMSVPLPILYRLTDGKLQDIDYQQHPLRVLAAIESQLMDVRRDTGRTARDLEGMAERLRQEVPGNFDQDAFSGFDLQEAVTTLEAIKAHEETVVFYQNSIERIDSQIADLEQRILELHKAKDRTTEKLEEQLACELPDAAPINMAIAHYKENAAYASKLKQAEEVAEQAIEKRKDYTVLSEQIDAVRAKPGQLLAATQLPVEGMGINEDGKVTINDLPISELSTGEQLTVAVQIAVATLGDLKIVLVDGLERLDPQNQDVILSALAASGIQAFVARVADSELTIITDYEAGDMNSDDIPF